MEQVTNLASSRFLIKRRASKKITRWRITIKDMLKVLRSSGIFKLLQSALVFTFACVVLLPALAYLKMMLKGVRGMIAWKINREHNKKSQPIEIIPEYYRNDDLNVNAFITFIAMATGEMEFITVKDRFEKIMVDESMKKRLCFAYGTAFWSYDEEFSIDRQLFMSSGRRRNGEPITETNFCDFVSEMKTDQRNFPTDRPPWQVVLVPFKNQSSYAIILHAHHLLVKKHPHLSRLNVSEFPFTKYCQTVKDHNHYRLIEAGVKLINALKSKFPHFNYAAILNKEWVHKIWVFLTSIRKTSVAILYMPRIILMELINGLWPSVKDNPFRAKKPLLHSKRNSGKNKVEVAWSEGVSEELINSIAYHSGKSFQEVLASCCAGALHHYLGKYICHSPEDIIASVNANWPASPDLKSVSMKLCTGMSDCQDRLMKTSLEGMHLQQNSLAYLMSGWAMCPQTLYSVLPKFVVGGVQHLLHRKHAITYSNSSTSMETMKTVFGDDAVQMLYWSNVQFQIGLHLSLINTNRQITLCVQSNTAIAPEPQVIATGFIRELNELTSRVGIQRPRTPTGLSRHRSRTDYFLTI